MKNIEIKIRTSIDYTKLITTSKSELEIEIKILNNSNKELQIKGFSILKKSWVFWKELSHINKSVKIKPHNSDTVYFNAKDILKHYNIDTSFVVKIFTERKNYKTKTVSLKSLNSISGDGYI